MRPRARFSGIAILRIRIDENTTLLLEKISDLGALAES